MGQTIQQRQIKLFEKVAATARLPREVAKRKVIDLGWDIESDYVNNVHSFRAFQGGFKTLWRGSPEEVLADVRKIHEARGKPSACPF